MRDFKHDAVFFFLEYGSCPFKSTPSLHTLYAPSCILCCTCDHVPYNYLHSRHIFEFICEKKVFRIENAFFGNCIKYI